MFLGPWLGSSARNFCPSLGLGSAQTFISEMGNHDLVNQGTPIRNGKHIIPNFYFSHIKSGFISYTQFHFANPNVLAYDLTTGHSHTFPYFY
jgi:hypothetical protein